jgi:phage regulator Rha-like protein
VKNAPTTSLTLSSNQVTTMSSREIADLAGARHNDVLATIDRLFDKGLLRSSRISRAESTGGRPIAVYDLVQRDVYLVISGYSDDVRARIVDRWEELEAQVSKPTTPAELSRMDILRLAMESEEARLKAEAERDHAIATKALIGSRREASAMATASHAKREVERLKAELGVSRRWATVKAVERATKREFPWLPLKKWCDAHEVEIRKVPDPLYGNVNSYPDNAWADVYDISLSEVFA